MKKILSFLFEHKTLSREQAKEVLINIAKGVYNESEITSFITVYLMRSITIPELQGFRDALLELCIRVDLDGMEVLDIVGTGGDGKNTFNISTLSCFIVAGTGNKVAKHGNYGASSISGSSNVMEQLGYRFTNDVATLREELATANICFLHAPLFHPNWSDRRHVLWRCRETVQPHTKSTAAPNPQPVESKTGTHGRVRR